MAGVVVTIQINGIEAVNQKIEGVSQRARDLTIPMKQSSMVMISSIAKNFNIGGRPAPWTPLSPKYLRRKLAQGYSSTPLTRTGNLQKSITPRVERNGFKLGTSIVYARNHQYGTTVPARPYLVFQDEDVEQINRTVVDYIKGE